MGPLTALAFVVTIDNPARFRHSADVGAYLGLTPRHYQSGEVDRTRRISKRGNHQVRTYLFEAANVLLTVVRRGSALKRWGKADQTDRRQKGEGCRCSQNGCHPPHHLDRRH
ncbi:IS110 family transposase (plasmid) [Bradyrhizobium japonicum]|nr:IS110 family transposase [Bradyrhizobium japonicum]